MDRYKFATVWTKHEGYLGVKTYRSYCACFLLDFNRDVTYFTRNDDVLTYQFEGKKKQLTPDFKVQLNGSEFYLHCFKNATLSKTQRSLVMQLFPIEFWEHTWLIQNHLVTNIKLMRRYHHGRLFPDYGNSLEIPTLLDFPLTSQNLCDHLGFQIGEANKLLLSLSAYRKLKFDIHQPFTSKTEFYLVGD